MIENQSLKLFLISKFNKNIDEITDEEFNSLDSIAISGLDVLYHEDKIDFELIVKIFPNLKSITISSYDLSDKDIEILSRLNLEEVNFNDCLFNELNVKLNIFDSLKSLSFVNCVSSDYSYLECDFENLIRLHVINPKDEVQLDIDIINALNLNELFLDSCIVTNLDRITKFSKCESLMILWTYITSEEVEKLYELSALKKLYISEEYIDEEQKNRFTSNNVMVRHNLNDFVVDVDEE